MRKTKVKAGDKIRITNPILAGGHYDIGDILTVGSVDEDGDVYIEELDGHIICNMEFKVVPLPSADECYSVTNSDMLLGEDVEVGDRSFSIKVLRHKGRFLEGYSNVYAVSKDDFRRATEEEIAEHGPIKVGDKVRITDKEELTKLEEDEYEYQEGDVVRITEDHSGDSRNKLGDIGIITEIGHGSGVRVHVLGNGTNRANWQDPDSIELVAKAEDRADLE